MGNNTYVDDSTYMDNYGVLRYKHDASEVPTTQVPKTPQATSLGSLRTGNRPINTFSAPTAQFKTMGSMQTSSNPPNLHGGGGYIDPKTGIVVTGEMNRASMGVPGALSGVMNNGSSGVSKSVPPQTLADIFNRFAVNAEVNRGQGTRPGRLPPVNAVQAARGMGGSYVSQAASGGMGGTSGASMPAGAERPSPQPQGQPQPLSPRNAAMNAYGPR